MKKVIAVLVFVILLVSCVPITAPQVFPEPGETLISGVWGGWRIEAGGMIFSTPVGIKTIGYPVQVIQHDGEWFIWDNGYGLKIALLEE